MPAPNAQFRLPVALRSRLELRAREWGLGINETVKRLTVLADVGLDASDHNQVLETAAKLLDNFVEAAHYFSWRLDHYE